MGDSPLYLCQVCKPSRYSAVFWWSAYKFFQSLRYPSFSSSSPPQSHCVSSALCTWHKLLWFRLTCILLHLFHHISQFLCFQAQPSNLTPIPEMVSSFIFLTPDLNLPLIISDTAVYCQCGNTNSWFLSPGSAFSLQEDVFPPGNCSINMNVIGKLLYIKWKEIKHL